MSVYARVNDDLNKKVTNSAYPANLFLLLYEGAIKNIENAQIALVANNFNQAHVQIIVAQDTIFRLKLSLAAEGKKRSNLLWRYEELQSKLVDANIKKDARLLDEIKEYMIELRDWQQAQESPEYSYDTSLDNLPNIIRIG